MENLVYFMAIGSILRPLGIICGHMVYFMVIWYSFPRFGMLHQEKSGNPCFEAHAYVERNFEQEGWIGRLTRAEHREKCQKLFQRFQEEFSSSEHIIRKTGELNSLHSRERTQMLRHKKVLFFLHSYLILSRFTNFYLKLDILVAYYITV
jgi:hypothetical protein